MARPNKRRGKPRRTASLSAEESKPRVVKIEEIGAKGDGLAHHEGKLFYVPYAVEGDLVEIKPQAKRGDGYAAKILQVKASGEGRVVAPCPHYEQCGGCSLQHMRREAYEAWMQNQVGDVFARQGLRPEIKPAKMVEAGRRRRVSFEVIRVGAKVVFGFNGRHSHQVIEIGTCLLLRPEINQLIEPLKNLLLELTDPGDRGDIVINHIGGAADVVFALPGKLELSRLEALSAFAQEQDIGRISWKRHKDGTPESVVQRKPVIANFGKAKVEIPPGCFLQPSHEGEAYLVAAVLEGVADAKRIADLFSGCGTFSFPLAQFASVDAVEAAPEMIGALEKAAGRADLDGHVTGQVRDLDRQPLSGKELDKYDAVVFDPPRAGAKEQAQMIAESNLQRVIAVSCNPNTLARDAKLLAEGGFKLQWVVPVDQFPFTPHMEAVALFLKEN